MRKKRAAPGPNIVVDFGDKIVLTWFVCFVCREEAANIHITVADEVIKQVR